MERLIEKLMRARDPRDALTPQDWDAWRVEAERRGLGARLLTDVADRLGVSWPHTRRAEPLSTYTPYTFEQLFRLPAIGAGKLRTILLATWYAATSEDEWLEEREEPTPAIDSHVEGPTSTPEETAVEGWIAALETPGPEWPVVALVGLSEALAEAAVALRHKLAARERDLALLVSRSNPTALRTLLEVGTEAGLTRERVRQIVEKYGRRLRSRYPEWLARLREAYEAWRAWGATEPQLRSFRWVLEVFFVLDKGEVPAPDLTLEHGVHVVLRRAYARRETPLSLERVVDRVSAFIGADVSHEGVRAVVEGWGVCAVDGGEEVVYSRSRREVIHRALLEAATPLSHDELEARLGIPKPTLYSYVNSDPRLVQNEDQRWTLARRLPIRMDRGGLSLLAVPAGKASPPPAPGEEFDALLDDLLEDVFRSVTPTNGVPDGGTVEVPLEELLVAAQAELERLATYNVTVHGFYQLCGELLGSRYSAAFPEALGAVAFGKVVTEEGSLFEVGGRRRISSRQRAVEARSQDNVYWLQRAVKEIGAPCTLAELSDVLTSHYQGGPPYIHPIWVEYYEGSAGFRRYLHPRHPQLYIVVPDEWDGASPPSAGVYRLVESVAHRRRARYAGLRRSDFAAAPWFADLIDAAVGEPMPL